MIQSSDYPCRAVLTDQQWLKHMIDHHQMAVDVSKTYLPHAKSSILANLIRDLIRTQEFEIYLMNVQAHNSFDNVSVVSVVREDYKPTFISGMYPNKVNLSNTYCDPAFFHLIKTAIRLTPMRCLLSI